MADGRNRNLPPGDERSNDRGHLYIPEGFWSETSKELFVKRTFGKGHQDPQYDPRSNEPSRSYIGTAPPNSELDIYNSNIKHFVGQFEMHTDGTPHFQASRIAFRLFNES